MIKGAEDLPCVGQQRVGELPERLDGGGVGLEDPVLQILLRGRLGLKARLLISRTLTSFSLQIECDECAVVPMKVHKCAVAIVLLASAASTQAVTTYQFTNLGSLGNDVAYATDINNSGMVTGYSQQRNPSREHAFLYSNGSMTDLGALGASSTYDSRGLAINASGQVTGRADVPGGTTSSWHAFVSSGGSMTDIGTLGGNNSWGNDINNSGQVTGYSLSSGNTLQHGFLYSGGGMTDLGTLGGTYSVGSGINNVGQITGHSTITGDSYYHAFVYSSGAMTDLGTLGGNFSVGSGINDSGQVAGYSYISGDSAYHAFLYSAGTMSDLGTLGGTVSKGQGINALGQIVGVSDTAGNATHAFLYSDGTMTDLNTLTTGLGGMTLEQATAINDNGWIVGVSGNVAWLLTPDAGGGGGGGDGDGGGGGSAPEPSRTLLLGVASLTLLLRRRRG